MKKSFVTLGLVIVSVLGPYANAQEASNKKLGGQEFTGSVEVSKAPNAVWGKLTQARFLAKAIGSDYEKGSKTFAKVGDAARVKLNYSNDAGMYVVTHANPSKDLRMSFDPDNGSYICQFRLELSPVGKGTKITVTETYTESGPQAAAEIKKQTAQWRARMENIKAVVEGEK